MIFVAVYVPPADSHYYDVGIFVSLNALVRESGKRLVILGDLNARFSTLRKGFLVSKGYGTWRYSEPADSTDSPNLNARAAIGALDELILIDNLVTDNDCFPCPCTYRIDGEPGRI